MINVDTSHYRAASSMEVFWEHLEDGALDAGEDALRLLGYDDAVVDHALDPDSYYFPIEKDGVLRRPKGYSDDKIPVIALMHGQSMRLPQRDGFHPLQVEALDIQGLPLDTINEVEDFYRGRPARVTARSGRLVLASVVTTTYYEEDELSDLHYRSRPTIIFYVDQAAPNEPHCAATTLHELTHVVQALDRPVSPVDTRLNDELEAYAVEAALGWEEPFLGSAGVSMAVAVNSFRKKHLGKNSFDATPEFEEKIRADRILSVII